MCGVAVVEQGSQEEIAWFELRTDQTVFLSFSTIFNNYSHQKNVQRPR